MKKSSLLIVLIVLLGVVLRFYNLDKAPYGLYIDEVSIGYNAYTILHTGKDEYGVTYPLFFKAFNDYKEPVYIYMTSAAMVLFGKNDFSVRFFSAFFGSLTILVVYLFTKLLLEREEKKQLKNQSQQELIPLITAFLLAISPWHIHFSRGGFEVNVALFFYLIGIYCAFLCWRKKASGFLIVSCISLIITIYTYHTYKILTPVTWLIIAGMLFFFVKKLRKKILIISGIFIAACIPLVVFSVTAEGSSRFTQTSAFSEIETKNPLLKFMLYPMAYLRNYLSFFSPDFLFSYGDHNGRHQIVGMGLLYKWQLPFFVAGFFWLLKQKNKLFKFTVLGLFFAAPLIPAIAVPSPHTLRNLLMVIPLSIITAAGVYYVFNLLNGYKKLLMLAILIIIACIEFGLYLHRYYAHYPNVNALDWGAGYKATADKAFVHSSEFSHIVVDKRLDFAPVYFHFYTPDLQITFVDSTWRKPEQWKNQKVLFIRPFYGNRNEKQSIDQVYLPGPNQDIFAQFWKL